ncbi:MAG: hypothetical protein ACKVOE_05685 [Rickettsiales bacterium]
MTNAKGEQEPIHFSISPEEAARHGDFHAQYEAVPNPEHVHGGGGILECGRGTSQQI